MAQLKLSPERARIFRITHRDNLPWLLSNGLHCASSSRLDPDFVSIGDPDLVKKRRHRQVPTAPGGSLDDYIPFYFTPYSPMLYNILTGHRGIQRRNREEIIFLVSSFDRLDESKVRYVFSDRHALLSTARFFGDRHDLLNVDFELLQQRDFQRDDEDPGKMERYQAETLVHEYLPIEALLGLICFTRKTQEPIEALCEDLDVVLKVGVQQAWYFT